MLKRHYIFVADCYGIKRQHHVIPALSGNPGALAPSSRPLRERVREGYKSPLS